MSIEDSQALRLAEQLVLVSLADRESATRSELAGLTSLPKTTVVAASNSLIARGLLIEEPDDSGDRRAGRPSTRLRLSLGDRSVALLELGREGTVLSIADCMANVGGRQHVSVGRGTPFNEFVDAVRAGLKSISDRDIDGIVVSIPAAFQAGVGPRFTSHVSADLEAKYPQFKPPAEWFTGDPSEVLAEEFGCPVITENDANLAALGEARFGAGVGASSMVHLSLRAGIGAGLTIDGKLFRGASGVAGELAHITIDRDGRLCACGNRGCFITSIPNGPLLADQVSQAYERPVSMSDVMTLAAAGDIGVTRVLQDYGRSAATALAGFVGFFEPQMIVVDAALGIASAPVVAGVAERLALQVQPMVWDGITVVAGELDMHSQLMGAVALLRDRTMGDLARSVWRGGDRWSVPALTDAKPVSAVS